MQVLPTTRLAWLFTVFAVAIAILGISVVHQYRDDHRDEFRQQAIPWHRFEMSDDLRTLSFFPYGGAPCWEPHHVDLQGSGPITATAIYRMQIRRDGHPMFCTANLTGLPPLSITLDEPLDLGTTIVDGAELDPFFCSQPTVQRVGEVRSPPPQPFYQC
jgi:hypothetical protein